MSLNNFSLDLWRNCVERQMKKPVLKLVGLGGFEPPTSPLSGVRSNQLSYRPKLESLAYFISGRFPDLTLLFTQNQGVRSNQLSAGPKLESLAYFISGRFPDLTLLFTQNQGLRSNQLSARPKLESLEVFNKDRCRPHPDLYLEPGDTL
jgi:hypothetical protein